MVNNMIIDTHIHLYDEAYKNLEQVLHEATIVGVKNMIVVGYDYHSSKKAIALANKYEDLYASVGLHPSEIKKKEDLNWVRELIKEPKVVAVGEIGLDYYWDRTYEEFQRELFFQQLEIAEEANLPVIIHSREAALDTLNILKKKPIPGVMHCFAYSLEMAREFIKLGYYLGIGGVLTFKNSKKLKEVVQETPLEHLLSETDGPYLAPHPFRGKVNRPAYLPYIIEAISEIKNIDIETVKMTLAKNAKDVFKI